MEILIYFNNYRYKYDTLTHNTQPTTLTTHSLHRTVIHQRVSAVQLTQCRLREEAVEAAQVEVADLTLAIGACDEGRGRWCE